VAEEATSAPDDEEACLRARRDFRKTGSGYSAIQSTRPQTLAYGLTDSPAGQLRLAGPRGRTAVPAVELKPVQNKSGGAG
jgi:hypothetical protein